LDVDDRCWVSGFIRERWGSDVVVGRGLVHRPECLPGFVAVADNGRVGLATYEITDASCELVTLDSVLANRGVGTALIRAVIDAAVEAGCERLWLITTNDNLPALRFYQKRGFVLAAVHCDAISEDRKLKPEIPLVGHDGIPIRDEIELDLLLTPLRIGTEKVVAYVTHGTRLLVFRHVAYPEAGIQVPAGTVEAGELLKDAVLREAREETGLEALDVCAYLGHDEIIVPRHGALYVYLRHFFHLAARGDVPERWCWFEREPSDGSPAPIEFELYWVDRTEGLPQLSGRMDAFLGRLGDVDKGTCESRVSRQDDRTRSGGL
jgi:ADP-ribose pyrophosphatase YjhB (NUDIX family)/GNAT superfamily N-acetyltransferase